LASLQLGHSVYTDIALSIQNVALPTQAYVWINHTDIQAA